MAKIIMANNNSKAMLTKGPIALPMADITTCKPEKERYGVKDIVIQERTV